MPGHSVLRVACAVALGALLLASPAWAASFSVQNGQTVGQQWLTDPGDTGTVEQGGTIYTSSDDTPGVNATGEQNTLLNYGTIDSNGVSSFGVNSTNINATIVNESTGLITGYGSTYWTGIFSTGWYADLENRGTIDGSGQYALGIYSDGAYATVGNTGSITTSGFKSGGIYTDGHDANVQNEGSIGVSGDYSNGIVSVGDDLSAVNTGSIGVSGFGSIGVNISGESPEVLNVGTITTSGEFSTGIFSNSNYAVIVNRGEITTSDDYSEGIYVLSGDGAVVINSGKVFTNGYDTWAIDMEGTNSTLDLLAGTVLQGGLYYVNADTATLNIGTGLNTALTFNTLPATINTSGQPYVIDGALLAVVDPTGLAAANSFGLDLSRTILDTVEARMTVPDTAGMTTGALPGSDAAVHRDFWTAGLGFYGDHTAQGSLDGYGYGAAGMMAGADRALSADSTAGLFGGVSAGSIATDAGSTNINAVGAFAGGYFSRDDGKAFTHLSLVGGGLDNSSDRTVANNLVSGGLETARAEYGSFYASPALTLGLHEHMGDAIVSPSVGLRYAGIYRGGYTESGSAADVTADSGTGQALDVRGAVRTDLAATVGDAGVRRFNVTAGVDGIFTWGGAVDGTLLGTDITLLASGQQSVARGFLGAGTTFDDANGTHFSADFNASYDTADAFGLAAQAGMNRTF